MLKRQLFPIYRWTTVWHGWSRRHFTGGGLLVFWSICFAGAVGIDTTFTMAYQAFALLACLLVFSFAWARLARGRFTGRRRLPRLGTVGQPLAYRILLQNPTRRAQRELELVEELPDARPRLAQFLEQAEPGEERRNWFDRMCGYYRWQWLVEQNRPATAPPLRIPALPPQGAVEIAHELIPRQRGPLALPGFIMRWPDPFGLCRSVRRVRCPQTVLILPKRYPLPALKLPGTRQYQPGGVALASAVGESEEFVGLRDYRPGDPLRRLHWRSLAKTGKPIIKEYQDEFFVRHGLVLDAFSLPGQEEVFEEAVAVAASFACTIPDQDSLLDLLFVGPAACAFTAGRSLARAEQMMEVLAGVTACRERGFGELRDFVLQHAVLMSSCICVLLAWDAARRELVRQLQRRGIPVLVLVITPAGADGGALETGPLPEGPGSFHRLAAGRIAEGLARL